MCDLRAAAKLLPISTLCLIIYFDAWAGGVAVAQSVQRECTRIGSSRGVPRTEFDSLPLFARGFRSDSTPSEPQNLTRIALNLESFSAISASCDGSRVLRIPGPSAYEGDSDCEATTGRKAPCAAGYASATSDGPGRSVVSCTSNPVTGGLWISGDINTGLRALRWIIGSANDQLLYVEGEGQVRLRTRLLAEMAGVTSLQDPNACAAISNYVASREGLLLMTQLLTGRRRYLLHVGWEGPTMGGLVQLTGEINVDNRFDGRINPRRTGGRKLSTERPPIGFDDLVAINPAAIWYNLDSYRLVPFACILFHELAEAYGKVALGLQYLPAKGFPGAHDLALVREMILRRQRPFSGVIVTAGFNRIFKNESEFSKFRSRRCSGGIDQYGEFKESLIASCQKPHGAHREPGKILTKSDHNTAESLEIPGLDRRVVESFDRWGK